MVKNSSAKAGDVRDTGLIPGLGRSPRRGNGNPEYFFGKIAWTEDPGRLQSIGWQRVRHDWSELAHTHVCEHLCGFFRWLSGKEFICQYRRCRFDPWVGRISWSRKWQLTPLFLPGKFHGQRSLVGYNPWAHERVRHDWAAKQHENISVHKSLFLIIFSS